MFNLFPLIEHAQLCHFPSSERAKMEHIGSFDVALEINSFSSFFEDGKSMTWKHTIENFFWTIFQVGDIPSTALQAFYFCIAVYGINGTFIKLWIATGRAAICVIMFKCMT